MCAALTAYIAVKKWHPQMFSHSTDADFNATDKNYSRASKRMSYTI